MAHAEVPLLPCAHAGWAAVSAQLRALAAAPPASGAALVAALIPLRAALGVRVQTAGMATYFDAPSAPPHRSSFLHDGGLAAALAAAAGLQEAVDRSNATCASAPLRLLRAGFPRATSLTREAATALLATAFLCLMSARDRRWPNFCFNKLWFQQGEEPSHAAKLDCHLHYFRSRAAAQPAPGVLRFERRAARARRRGSGGAQKRRAHAALPAPCCAR